MTRSWRALERRYCQAQPSSIQLQLQLVGLRQSQLVLFILQQQVFFTPCRCFTYLIIFNVSRKFYVKGNKNSRVSWQLMVGSDSKKLFEFLFYHKNFQRRKIRPRVYQLQFLYHSFSSAWPRQNQNLCSTHNFLTSHGHSRIQRFDIQDSLRLRN